jgi:Matrixin
VVREAMFSLGPIRASIRRTRLLVLGLVLAAGVAAVAAGEADASSTYGYADSDGYVPIYSVCWAGYEVGAYDWYFDGYAVYGTIYINDCALARLGAGPYDRQQVVAHELGHSRGLPHSYDPNSYMYYWLTVTGT